MKAQYHLLQLESLRPGLKYEYKQERFSQAVFTFQAIRKASGLKQGY